MLNLRSTARTNLAAVQLALLLLFPSFSLSLASKYFHIPCRLNEKRNLQQAVRCRVKYWFFHRRCEMVHVLIPRSLLFSSLDLERSNSEIPNNLKGGIRLKVFQKRHHRSQLLSHRTDTRIHSRFRAINRIGRKEDRKKKRSRFERKKVFQSNIL